MRLMTKVMLFLKVKRGNFELTVDEVFDLFQIIDNPFSNIQIDWLKKKVLIKGLNIEFHLTLPKQKDEETSQVPPPQPEDYRTPAAGEVK